MTLYISGKITGDPDYKRKFAEAQKSLETKGYDIINPCEIGEYAFLSYEQLLHIDFALIDVADAIYLLRDWAGSSGAKREKEHAEMLGKKVMYEH